MANDSRQSHGVDKGHIVKIAGDYIGTAPAMQTSGCVDALVIHTEQLRERAERAEAELQHWREAAEEIGTTDGHGMALDFRQIRAERDAMAAKITRMRTELVQARMELAEWQSRALAAEEMLADCEIVPVTRESVSHE